MVVIFLLAFIYIGLGEAFCFLFPGPNNLLCIHNEGRKLFEGFGTLVSSLYVSPNLLVLILRSETLISVFLTYTKI